MDIIFVLLPISLLLAICGLFAYLWGTKNGQFDDLETPALKMLIDEEEVTKESSIVSVHKPAEK